MFCIKNNIRQFGLLSATLWMGVISGFSDVAVGEGEIVTTVTADSQLHVDRFEPYKILDGDTVDSESRWASAREPAIHWIAFEFETPLTIDKVLVYSQPDPYTLLDAQLQADTGGGWQTIDSINDNSDVLIELTFTAVTTDKVRLYITDSCTYDDTARLYEMEFYHNDVLHPAIPVELLPGDIEQVIDFPITVLTTPPTPGTRNADLMQEYFDSIFEWDDILLAEFLPVPGHPDWGYYGLGGNTEDHVRPICYAVMVNAFLSEVVPPTGGPDAARRQRMRDDAIAALRYLTQAHVTGGGACLNGLPWGNAWQSAMWARAAGLGGWMIWDYLDTDLKVGVMDMVVFEANRFISQPPKSSEFGDTGAEENAWNALITSLAYNMMPTHANNYGWNQAAKKYLYNTFSVTADHSDPTIGDDGLAISDWVTTVNAHPDYTVENHGLVHVGYLKTSLSMLLENAVHYPVTGNPIPNACFHHASDAAAVLNKCMSWEAAPIYFGGNDWKTVHTQNSDINIYATLNVLDSDPLAAYEEETALYYLRAMQQLEGGYYNVRRDIEFGGLCATRLISCYIAHALEGAGTAPITETQFNQQVSNLTLLEYGEVIIHRTPTKYASFTWGPKRIALAYPENGTWVHWPHYSSYLGNINGVDPSESNASLQELNTRLGVNNFSATGRLSRLGGNVTQDFSFTSLPGDLVIYIEHLTAQPGYSVTARETGILGHEYGLGENTRVFYGEFGSQEVIGVDNPAQTITWDTDWLNLDDQVGYIVCRQAGRNNLMRYHDLTDGSGTVPKLQEWFSLVGDSSPSVWTASGDWVCIVVFLNQLSGDTAQRISDVNFEVYYRRRWCASGFQYVYSQSYGQRL
ncbi:MAG: discoidin domain-containing protein [Sedimentisphaerales bacterium]|nr:discoidin domain-containing protein [Sedimentisphaerales bacterium]